MSQAATTYARALFEAVEGKAAAVADELDQVAALAVDAPETWDQLTRPGIAASALHATIDRMLADGQPATRNVLKLLVDNGRLEDVPAVARELRVLVDAQTRQLDVHVTTAVELSDDLRSKLEQRLSESTGQTVTLHASVDPAIIGGLVVRHGDTLVDTSLKGRLEQLRLDLSRPGSRPGSSETTTG